MTTRNSYIFKVFFAGIFSLILTLLVISPTNAKENNQQNDPYRVETFALNAPGDLQVRTSGGHITVEGSNSEDVRVEMFVHKNGDNLMPEDTDLEDWDIDITKDGSKIKAIAKRKGNSGWKLFGNKNNVSISFTVYTPREMSSDLRTSGGHIKIDGLSGNQKLSTSGGHLTLANLEGTVDARTSGGHINIDKVKGDIDARTSGGHISVENAEGKIRVKTSGGHLNFADIKGALEASTSGGNIKADLTSVSEMVELRTSGGNISITIPENQGFDLDLRGSYVSTDLKNFSGQIDRNEVEGKLNGGGTKIAARTSGGTVSLHFN